MSDAALPGISTGAAGTALPYRFRDVAGSEWTKARSVRSTWLTLLLTVVVVVGVGALIAAGVASHYPGMRPADKVTFDPTQASFYSLDFGQLTLSVLAILLVTSEYASGTIQASLEAVPRRSWLLGAKVVVFTAVGLVVGELASFACYLITQATLEAHSVPHTNLGQPGVLRAVVGAGLYLTVTGLGALAVAAIVRHTAGAISLIVAVYYLLLEVTGALPSSLRYPIEKYSPTGAGATVYAVRPQAHLFSGWAGFAVLCGYVAAALACALWAMQQRDA